MNKIQEHILTLQMLIRQSREGEKGNLSNIEKENIKQAIIKTQSDLTNEMRIQNVETEEQQKILNESLLIGKL